MAERTDSADGVGGLVDGGVLSASELEVGVGEVGMSMVSDMRVRRAWVFRFGTRGWDE